MKNRLVLAIFFIGILLGVGVQSLYVDVIAAGQCGAFAVVHVSQLRNLLSCYNMRLDNLDSYVDYQDKRMLELTANMDALRVDFYNNATLPEEPKLNSTEVR